MKRFFSILLFIFCFYCSYSQQKSTKKTSSTGRIIPPNGKVIGGPNSNTPGYNQYLYDIIGIYESSEEIINGVHIYLMLTDKMEYATSQSSEPNIETDRSSWMRSGKFKFDGQYITFDYGKSWEYKGNGHIDAGPMSFQWIKGINSKR